MMRINTGIVCVLAALTAGACSSGNGSGPTPDAAPVVCGDNVCAASEVHSCPQDCGTGGGSNHGAVCGNGLCETSMGESQTTCQQDCGGGSNTQPVCGNGTCETGEDSTTCPSDCTGGGSGALDCADPNTALGCAFCSAAMVCTPPYDMASCAACGF